MTYNELYSIIGNQFLLKDLSISEKLTISNAALVIYYMFLNKEMPLNIKKPIRKILPEDLKQINIASIKVLDFIANKSDLVKSLTSEQRLLAYRVAQNRIAALSSFTIKNPYTFNTIRTNRKIKTNNLIMLLKSNLLMPLFSIVKYVRTLMLTYEVKNVVIPLSLVKLIVKMEFLITCMLRSLTKHLSLSLSYIIKQVKIMDKKVSLSLGLTNRIQYMVTNTLSRLILNISSNISSLTENAYNIGVETQLRLSIETQLINKLGEIYYESER